MLCLHHSTNTMWQVDAPLSKFALFRHTASRAFTPWSLTEVAPSLDLAPHSWPVLTASRHAFDLAVFCHVAKRILVPVDILKTIQWAQQNNLQCLFSNLPHQRQISQIGRQTHSNDNTLLLTLWLAQPCLLFFVTLWPVKLHKSFGPSSGYRGVT